MDDPRESNSAAHSGSEPTISAKRAVEGADAAIAWYLSDEFEEHLGKCFEDGKRKALDARERFLTTRQDGSAHEAMP
jgi:hypothetical protein